MSRTIKRGVDSGVLSTVCNEEAKRTPLSSGAPTALTALYYAIRCRLDAEWVEALLRREMAQSLSILNLKVAMNEASQRHAQSSRQDDALDAGKPCQPLQQKCANSRLDSPASANSRLFSEKSA